MSTVKLLLLTLVYCFVGSTTASASLQRFWAFCEQGNQTINVLSYTSSTATPVQRSFPGCTVDVFFTGTTNRPTIYSNSAGTVSLTNPFTANGNGFFFFYAANGEYDVQESGGGLPAPWTIGDILLNSNSANPDVPVSLVDFGCKGDGSTNDTVCVQTAINSVQGSGGTLLVNAGKNFCIGTVFITGSMSLSGPGSFKRCVTLPTGQGVIDITGSNITLSGFSADGQTTSPQVFINYAAAPVSPFDNTMTLNTFIWVHPGSSYVTTDRLTINHTGGYAEFIDARTGNLSHIRFINSTVTNSRSSLAGAPGDFIYGGWTGGVLWANDGVTYTISDLDISHNRFLQNTGNNVWGHSNAITKQNTGLNIQSNYFEDCGLDCIQAQNFNNGIVAHNWGKRVGYVTLTDNTPGNPRWTPAVDTLSGFSVPAVAVDTTALVTNVTYDDNNFDAINGGWYDGDGYGYGSVRPGVGTSCWYSVDPFANASACGPGSNGQNFAYGWNSGDSSGSSVADTNVNITGGQFNGFGGGAIKIYGCQGCKVIGASINHPSVANFTPIAYGPFTISGTTFYPTKNEISNNTAFWSPTTGAVVSEDATYAPFISSVVNIVRNNICIGTSGTACYELAKDPNSSTTSGPVVTHSVTPQVHGIVDSFQQTEGTSGSNWAFSEYANINGTGTLFRTCNFLACFFPEEVNAIGVNYIGSETGSNNAIAGSLSGVPLTVGLKVSLFLQHSLQAGSNSFAYNGGPPLPIVQHVNPSLQLAVPYAVNGSITLMYDGAHWQDMSVGGGGGGGGTVTAVTASLPLASSGGSTPNISIFSAQGNGSKVQLSTGSTITNDCAKFDANGNTVDAGISCAAPSTIPFNNITSATNTVAAMVVGTGASLAATGSGTITATNTVQVNGAAIPTAALVLASNSSNQIIAATLQGNGLKAQMSTGTTTTNDCVKFDANGNTVDAGAACATSTPPPFNTITSGTNTAATMVVGTGASLSVSGSGTIGATNTINVNGAAVPTSAAVVGTNPSNQLVAATLQGNGAKVQLSTGTTTTNDCVKFDSNGNTVDAGSACNVTAPAFNTITSGTNTTAAMVVGTGASLAASGSGTIHATTSDNTTGVNGGAVPANVKALATNSSSQLVTATFQGNGTKVQLSTGTTTTNDCAKFDANGNVIDSGTLCSGSSLDWVNAISIGANGNGTFDNAPTIQTFATSVGTGGAVLYFPAGTYYFATNGPIGSEECVRFNGNVSIVGDGPGRTIFKTDVSTPCQSIVGYFASNAADYTYETDNPPGGVSGIVNASSAIVGSNVVVMTTSGDAAHYTAGMWVYLRGTSTGLPSGEYHGELNQVIGNSGADVQLLWPLSSSFINDGTGIRLNQVSSTEIIQHVSIQGITWNVYQQAILGAQQFDWRITNNIFNRTTTTTGGIFQFNQYRHVVFDHNTINTYQSSGNALDPARNPTDWNVHDNVINGGFSADEAGGNIKFENNSVYCVNTGDCVSAGGVTNMLINNNTIFDWDTTGGAPDVVYDALNFANIPSFNVVISNNTISSNVPVRLNTYGTVASGNTLNAQTTGFDVQNGGISLLDNVVHLTSTGTYGCILIEGTLHSDIINGLDCSGVSGTLGFSAIYIGDEGAQTDQLIINNVHGQYLTNGINVSNTAHDSPLWGLIEFKNNVTTPFPGGGPSVLYRCSVAGTLRAGQTTTVSADCGTAVDTGLLVR